MYVATCSVNFMLKNKRHFTTYACAEACSKVSVKTFPLERQSQTIK